jgi:hypothetical protein
LSDTLVVSFWSEEASFAGAAYAVDEVVIFNAKAFGSYGLFSGKACVFGAP